jgi:DNA-binding MarR family transcriptional regulator
MGVEPSTASRHVQTLEARGWLVKQPDTADRRACMAAVTPAGVELVEQIEVERHRILERALATWTDEELDRFTGLFERFANDLSDLLVALES